MIFDADIDALAAALVSRMGLPPHIDAALTVLQRDPHQWSTRRCDTCRAVSSLVGKPFGCDLYRQQKKEHS